MSEFKPNGYFVDKNGQRIEVVDAEARNKVSALTEEMEALKESSGETVTDTGAVVCIDAEEGSKIKVSAETTETVTLVHQGKNYAPEFPAYNANGLVGTNNSDGTYTLKGTNTSSGSLYITPVPNTSPRIFPAGTYVASSTLVKKTGFLLYIAKGGASDPLGSVSSTGSFTFTLDEPTPLFWYVHVASGTEIDATFYLQIERNTSASEYDKHWRVTHNGMFPMEIEAKTGANVMYTESGDVLTATAFRDLYNMVKNLKADVEALKGETEPKVVTYTPELDGFISSTNGNIIASTEYAYHTDYIPLNGYERIVAQAHITSAGYLFAFYNDAKVLLTDISVVGNGVTADGPSIYDFVVPETATYCVMSHYAGHGINGPVYNGYITLYPPDAGETDDPLFGKTINALGDSITSTGYVRPTWWEMIAEKAGCYFNNHGVSGTSIAVRDGRTDSFVERAATMQTDVDAVIVMGGTNDSATPRGAWDSTDSTTFFGALNNLIVLLCDVYQGKPIIICTPIQTANDFANNVHNPAETLMSKTDTDKLTMQQRAAAIKLKCEQYGMHCLDLYNSSGIGGTDSNNVYYRDGDTLHPSEAGQKRLANLMRRELERFFGIE